MKKCIRRRPRPALPLVCDVMRRRRRSGVISPLALHRVSRQHPTREYSAEGLVSSPSSRESAILLLPTGAGSGEGEGRCEKKASPPKRTS